MALLGCSNAQDRRHGPRGRSFRQTCELPSAAPPDLVLEAARTIIPGGESITERGQLTSSGACDASVPDCVRVERDVLAGVYDKIRKLTAPGFVSRNEEVSPHVGFRTFKVRWRGGECSFVDGVTDPLAEVDKKRFVESYGAIVATMTALRRPSPSAVATCRQQLEVAVTSYNATRKPRVIATLTATESADYGHHGEAPIIAFTVAGGSNVAIVLWRKDRNLGTSDWFAGEGFVARERGASTAMLWKGDDAFDAFVAAFQLAADACLDAFAGRSP